MSVGGGLAASLERLVADLDAVGARWALVGGFAVSTRAEPRFTRVVDVCLLADTDAEAESIAHRLSGLGYRVASIIEHEYVGRLSTLRLVSPIPTGVLVDLLFASSGIEPEIVREAEPMDVLPGVTVRVAGAAHLVVLKLLSRDDEVRPQDGLDLRALRPVLTAEDGADVLRLARLVVERGFGRGRDLVGSAETYLAEQ